MQPARTFTQAMHAVSLPASSVWPDMLDLSDHRHMLDIGGGSGAHSIGAVRRWSTLTATVFELAPVCEVAQGYIADLGLEQRIQVHVGDMWADPYPPADLHFYSWIYATLPESRRQFLSRKSYESLPPGGHIIIHEMLYMAEQDGTFGESSGLAAQLYAEGWQLGRELRRLLKASGFTDIVMKPTTGSWSIISGRKG